MDKAGQTTRRDRLMIGAILLLALILRIYRLDAPLWYDEVITLTRFVRLPWPDLISDFSSLNNHMLYSVEAKASVSLFGESAWALRLPAVLLGVGSIALMWPLARTAAGRWPTLAAMLLAAISYHHIWFSQNARGYTELLFFTMLATVLLVRAVASDGRWIWAAYAASLALAMYTHLSAGFFLAAHGLVGLWMLARGAATLRLIWAWILGGILTLLLYLPIIPQVLPTMNQVSDGKTSSTMAEWTNPLRTLGEISSSFGPLGPVAPLIIIAALVAIGLGIARFWRRDPVIAAIYVLSVPVSLAMLIVISFRIWPRYFFVDLNMILVFATLGCMVIADWLAKLLGQRWSAPLFGLAVVAMVAVSLALLPKNYRAPKQDFAGAVAEFQRLRTDGDRLAAISLAVEPLQSYFAPEATPIVSMADLERLRADSHNVWVITVFDNHAEKGQEEILSVVEHDANVVRKFDGTLGGGTVRIFRIPGHRIDSP